MIAGRLDSRTWLVWGIATVIPLLVARHPLVVLELLIVVLAVRSVWAAQSAHSWQWIIRLAVIFMAFGVVFNVFTVHAGNQVIVTIPDSLPLIGGRITLNALVYGVVSGVTVLVLVLAGTIVASGIVWADLMRTMPPRLAPLAVAGSVAWSFLPSTASAFRDIREAQSARGHRIRGVRDLPPLVVPLLGGGLERAMSMSEALEARGFGQATSEVRGALWTRWVMIGALGGGMLAAYAFAVGMEGWGLAGLTGSVLLLTVALRHGQRPSATTRYREAAWRRVDRIVVVSASVALLLFLWRRWVNPEAAIFDPYPNLTWPVTDVLLLAGLAPLLAPAFFLPRPEDQP